MRVYKYPIPSIQDVVRMMMPKDAKVLTVQVQNGTPCIWAAVDPSQLYLETRLFRIAGTGHEIEDDIVDDYVGTFQMYDGKLVFHLFEIKTP